MQASSTSQDDLLTALKEYHGDLVEALESLWDVRPNHFAPTRVTVEREEHQIVAIDFKWMRLTDEAMALLALLPSLKRLNIHGADVTDVGLAKLTWLQNLEELNLGRTRVTDEGLSTLREFPHLKRVDLSVTESTDAGLVHIAELQSLETLYLDYCRKITNAGIMQLSGLPQLQLLHVRCTQICEDGAEEFVNAAPACEVIR